MALGSLLMLGGVASAQKVAFEEYDLDNGLHVILHQDKSAPVIITSVMYHVGSKDENPERTGFAHFFEHLLFEGTENIKRGEWFKIVTANGGNNNANTSDDRTYYYEVFPSNNTELGLWMESIFVEFLYLHYHAICDGHCLLLPNQNSIILSKN